MNGRLPGLQFRSRIFVDPKFIADSNRTVFRRVAPVTAAASLKRDRAIEVAQSGNARRRILIVGTVATVTGVVTIAVPIVLGANRRRIAERKKTGQTQEQAESALIGERGLQHSCFPLLGNWAELLGVYPKWLSQQM
jgi:hypothetical protein